MTLYPKEMVEYWEEIIRNNRDDYRTFVTNPSLFGQIDSLEDSLRVLDVGCGEGYVSRYLHSKGHDVTGMDFSAEFVRSANQYSTGSENYLVGDVQNLPFSNSSYDAVVANMLFMELENPDNGIAEVARILKKGGKFIFQMLHPSRGLIGGEKSHYFKSAKHVKNYLVDGLESPLVSVRYHHPLSFYTRSLQNNGFVIYHLDEPEPSSKMPKNNPLWEIFKEPNIMIIAAEKR